MQRRNSYSRSIYAPTTASRIADAKNKRETRLLVQTSRGLSCEKDWTLKNFFREKAKTNAFLKKIHRSSPGMLHFQRRENGRLALDWRNGFVAGNDTKIPVKTHGGRQLSRVLNHREEAQEPIQESLVRDFPSRASKNLEDSSELNGKNFEDGFEKENLSSDVQPVQATTLRHSEDESAKDVEKTNVSVKNPFKVRSRTSGICFCHCQELNLPPINLPEIRRRFSETGFGLKFPCNFEKNSNRKLSMPLIARHGRLL